MAERELLSRRTLSQGVTEIPATAIPKGDRFVSVTFDRNSWSDPDQPIIKAWFEISFDNGNTWTRFHNFVSNGNKAGFLPNGKPRGPTVFRAPAPFPELTSRVFRGRVEVYRSLDTKILLNTSLVKI